MNIFYDSMNASALFERMFCVSSDEIKLLIKWCSYLPWDDFLINPRRLRGSDFLMRWSQGVWSEHRLIEAVGDTGKYFAIPYGPSGTAPDDDVRAVELYFERLDKAGLGNLKRPDLLVYRNADKREILESVKRMGGIKELPFQQEDSLEMRKLIRTAILAVECENSLWKAELMPDFRAELKPQKRLGGKLGLKKTAVTPTIIIKEEDRGPLHNWQNEHKKVLHIWHAFYDLAFGIDFCMAEKLITSGQIEPTKQVFQAPGGATTTKIIYKIIYHHTYPMAKAVEEPKLIAASITDKNGHILPYVHFEGGKAILTDEAIEILDNL